MSYFFLAMVPSNLKILIPVWIVREITMVVAMRSASIQISAGSTTGTQLKDALQEASDSAEDGGIHLDFDESEADESISVEIPSFEMEESAYYQ